MSRLLRWPIWIIIAVPPPNDRSKSSRPGILAKLVDQVGSDTKSRRHSDGSAIKSSHYAVSG